MYLDVDFHICEEVSVETDSADLDIRTSEETTVQSDWMDNAAVLVTVSSSAFTVLSGIGSVEQDVVRQDVSASRSSSTVLLGSSSPIFWSLVQIENDCALTVMLLNVKEILQVNLMRNM